MNSSVYIYKFQGEDVRIRVSGYEYEYAPRTAERNAHALQMNMSEYDQGLKIYSGPV